MKIPISKYPPVTVGFSHRGALREDPSGDPLAMNFPFFDPYESLWIHIFILNHDDYPGVYIYIFIYCPHSSNLIHVTIHIESIWSPNLFPRNLPGPRGPAMARCQEHITSDIGSVGDFAAGSEVAFGTILQRTYSVLGARMHYGHPDIMNKQPLGGEHL